MFAGINVLMQLNSMCFKVTSWDENELSNFLNISGPEPGMADGGEFGNGRMYIWNSVLG